MEHSLQTWSPSKDFKVSRCVSLAGRVRPCFGIVNGAYWNPGPFAETMRAENGFPELAQDESEQGKIQSPGLRSECHVLWVDRQPLEVF